MGWNKHIYVLTLIKFDLSGFVVITHSGLCKQAISPIPRPDGLGIQFSVDMRPGAMWRQPTNDLVLTP